MRHLPAEDEHGAHHNVSWLVHLPSAEDREAHDGRSALVRGCAALAASQAFNLAIFAVIVANALVLGLETYDGIAQDFGGLLQTLNDLFLAVFVVELAIRLTAFGARPGGFFRSGWNVFDFVVVVASFTPGLRENAMLLRLARLARVLRVIRLLPDLRVLTLAVWRSIPGVLSLAVLMIVVLFIYGMVGWTIFAEQAPEQYGSIGEAMLTMFVLLTLENLPTQIEMGRQLSDWTLIYFISYALLAAFLVFNMLIGVVINSLEEAREIDREHDRTERLEHPRAVGEPAIEDRVAQLRATLDLLEADLKRA